MTPVFTELKLGMILIDLGTGGILWKDCGGVITQITDAGLLVRDTRHNNRYWITCEEVEKYFDLPMEPSQLSSEAFKEHGSTICDVNWAWVHQIGQE